MDGAGGGWHNGCLIFGRSYHRQEFVASPLDCGIPNSRPRYFCLASTHQFGARRCDGAICHGLPTDPPRVLPSEVRSLHARAARGNRAVACVSRERHGCARMRCC